MRLIFKDIALELLDHVEQNSVYCKSVSQLKEKISKFVFLNENAVPNSSLLNEFIK